MITLSELSYPRVYVYKRQFLFLFPPPPSSNYVTPRAYIYMTLTWKTIRFRRNQQWLFCELRVLRVFCIQRVWNVISPSSAIILSRNRCQIKSVWLLLNSAGLYAYVIVLHSCGISMYIVVHSPWFGHYGYRTTIFIFTRMITFALLIFKEQSFPTVKMWYSTHIFMHGHQRFLILYCCSTDEIIIISEM